MIYTIKSVNPKGDGWYEVEITLRPDTDVDTPNVDFVYLRALAHALITVDLHGFLSFTYDLSGKYELTIMIVPDDQTAWDKAEKANKAFGEETLKELIEVVTSNPGRFLEGYRPPQDLILKEAS